MSSPIRGRWRLIHLRSGRTGYEPADAAVTPAEYTDGLVAGRYPASAGSAPAGTVRLESVHGESATGKLDTRLKSPRKLT